MSLGFEPSRTVVLSFGFDEEASGLFVCPFKTRPFQGSKHQACKGAFELNKYLVAAFGQDSFAMLVDEGGMYTFYLPRDLMRDIQTDFRSNPGPRSRFPRSERRVISTHV